MRLTWEGVCIVIEQGGWKSSQPLELWQIVESIHEIEIYFSLKNNPWKIK